MARKTDLPAEQGREIALRLRAHPGRLRPVIRAESDLWGAVSLPLLFLAGLCFESFFAQQHQRVAELAINLFTVIGMLLYALVRVRRRTLDRNDPVLLVGMAVLLAGAGGCLLGLREGGVLPGVLLKTIGTVLILVALDRMERRSVVEALESSEEYLESFFESIPDPLVVIGEGQRVLAANRIAIHTFGEKILGEPCCKTYLRHDDCTACTVTQAWNKRKPRFELVRDEKGARRYEVTTFPLFGPRGFSGKLLQQIKDVSAHAESEDRASLLGDVVNSARDPVLTLGLRGELRHRNRASEAMFGPLKHDAHPSNGEILPFADPADRAEFEVALREFVPWERETTLLARDGQERRAALAIAPIRAVDDRLLGTVVIVRDVTDLKRLQEQLSQNEKLSALGEMVSGVAHELNNPLTAVFGFAQLLLAENLPAEQKEEIRHIFAHAERCKKIIDGLLKFARRHKAERVRTNLNEVVQSTVDLLGYQMKLADIRVELELDSKLHDSMMDSFQIQQVLINLLTNAQHAIKDAGRAGVVTIRTRQADERMVLEVEDNGCGMPESVLRRAFDPFFTTKGVGKGTGLGLSISYGIVREHGGTLTAASRTGEGSLFKMELPTVREPASAAKAAEPARTLPIAHSRVLVVDDEAIILELLGQFLRGDGHTVYTVSTVDEALQELERSDYDLVFSDWRMPGHGGQALYERLCERRSDYRGRVVFMTGDAISNDVTRFAQKDGNAMLLKPFTLESIRAAVAHVCRPVDPVEAATSTGGR
jgi:PAS domain S-box-containing protein